MLEEHWIGFPCFILSECFESVLNILKSYISNGYYLWCHLNEFYVPNRSSYGVSNRSHQNLIYGYNEQNMQLNISGYASNRKYKQSLISYEEFKLSLNHMHFNQYSNNNNISIGCFKHNGNVPQFNMKKFVNELHQYYYGGSVEGKKFFGMSAYKHLKQHVKDSLHKNINLRYIHLLNEHKQLMHKKIQYLIDINALTKNDYLQEFILLSNKTSTILSLCIKNNIKSSESNINKICKLLDDVESLEKITVLALLKDLKKYCGGRYE
ncbi:MAG: hypothetical protein FWC08_01780 [Defluviitaleaceae bacterium]|nr:hypothetical protein [Defluviitaleaceae bacterium]